MAGRPTDYKEEYDTEIIVLASQEFSMFEIATKWEVCVETLHEWTRVHKSFSEAFTRGRNIQISLFMEKMRNNIGNKDYNSKLCALYMKTALKVAENRTMSVDTEGKNLTEIATNIIKSLKDDKLTAQEFTQIMSGISTVVKIDEVTNLREELLKERDKRVKHNKENE